MSAAPYRHPPRIRRLLEGLVAVVCPPEAAARGLAPAIADRVELSMRALPRHVRAGLVSGLAAYEAGSLADPRHRGRAASALPPDRADRYFARWWHSRLAPQRELAKGVKGLLCLACYEMPEMKEALGYDPEAWIAGARERRLARHGGAIRAHDAALRRPDPLPRAPGGGA